MEYTIFVRDNIDELCDVAKARISERWEPLGGIVGFYSLKYNKERWGQAFIRTNLPSIDAELATSEIIKVDNLSELGKHG